MSIDTRSIFYYDYSIDDSNYQINFNEGGAELTANLSFGDYSFSGFLTEIKTALDAAGALTYTVTANRSTRIITIAATGTFAILVSTGTSAATPYSLMGFTGADRTGAASYAGNSASGSAYSPQFNLQKYVPPENSREKKNVTVHETADSSVEVVFFGDVQMIEADIMWATNIAQPSTGPIYSNTNGVANLNAFMSFIISKAPFEFMPDIDDPDTFYKVILESTPEVRDGTKYKLKENLRAPGYYDTGTLTFRVIN